MCARNDRVVTGVSISRDDVANGVRHRTQSQIDERLTEMTRAFAFAERRCGNFCKPDLVGFDLRFVL